MKYILILSCFFLNAKIIFAQQEKSTNDNKPFVLGEIKEITSKTLPENRTLNIYLPPGYKTADSIKYPVIYLLDGSADEDFIHIVGLVQFFNFPWVNILPESIVVGIANVDRRRDFTYPTTIEKDKKDFPTTGKSEVFIRFLESELIPYIEKNYKTNTTKTIIGQSLGGLLATEILFKKPGLFSKYIIVSPSLWWDKESLLSLKPKMLAADFVNPLSVFIAVGNEGKIMEADAKKLAAILKSVQKNNIMVHTEHFTKEDHANILHKAVYDAFETFNTRLKEKK